MVNSFENIQKSWKASKAKETNLLPIDNMLQLAIENQKKSKKAHVLNIIILSIVCIVISVFFVFVTPMHELLSQIGIGFMIGGLILRIIIEIFSKHKASKIKYDFNTLIITNKALDFYSWRKKIHGPVTFLIVFLYTIGIFLLNPEFTNYFGLTRVLIFDMLYIVIAIILFFVIRTGVVKELHQLKHISNINTDLKNESSKSQS